MKAGVVFQQDYDCAVVITKEAAEKILQKRKKIEAFKNDADFEGFDIVVLPHRFNGIEVLELSPGDTYELLGEDNEYENGDIVFDKKVVDPLLNYEYGEEAESRLEFTNDGVSVLIFVENDWVDPVPHLNFVEVNISWEKMQEIASVSEETGPEYSPTV